MIHSDFAHFLLKGQTMNSQPIQHHWNEQPPYELTGKQCQERMCERCGMVEVRIHRGTLYGWHGWTDVGPCLPQPKITIGKPVWPDIPTTREVELEKRVKELEEAIAKSNTELLSANRCNEYLEKELSTARIELSNERRHVEYLKQGLEKYRTKEVADRGMEKLTLEEFNAILKVHGHTCTTEQPT